MISLYTPREAEKDGNAQPDKAGPEAEDTRQEWEKPLNKIEPKNKPKSRQNKASEKTEKKSSHTAKQEKAPKPDKSTEQEQAENIGDDTVSTKVTKQVQQEAPAPEQPSELREAPRLGEQEQSFI